MKLDIAAELCKKFEGFKSRPYLCPAGIPTIGYGTTFYPTGQRVKLTDSPIDELTASAFLQHGLRSIYAPAVLRLCPGLLSDESKFNAIVDFAYNFGPGKLQTSTLRRRLNQQDWEGAQEQLLRWVRGDGRILPGLVRRRQAESDLLK